MKEQVLSLEQLNKLGSNEKVRDIIREHASMYWEYKGADGENGYYNLDVLDFDVDDLGDEDKPTLTLTDIIDLFVEKGCRVEVASGKMKHKFYFITPQFNSYTFESDSLINAAYAAFCKGVGVRNND